MKLMSPIFAVLVMFMSPAHADPDHFAAHVGTAFTLQTTLYGANSRWLGMSKTNAELLSFAEMMVVGFAYKQNEGMPTGTAQSITQNAIGGALAIGVHITFVF